MSRSAKLSLDPRAISDSGWRDRWRAVRELLGGALILAVWLSLWSWVALGVAAPLGRLDGAAPQAAGAVRA
jgi:hypothetical protein